MRKLEVSVRKQVSLECECRCSKINFEVEDWDRKDFGRLFEGY